MHMTNKNKRLQNRFNFRELAIQDTIPKKWKIYKNNTNEHLLWLIRVLGKGSAVW